MKITCTENEREQLCNGATLCYFIARNNYCNKKDGCCKCREENIEWEITNVKADEKNEQSEENEYTREDVIKSLKCCSDGHCYGCPFKDAENGCDKRNKLVIEYIQATEIDKSNEPLTLYDLIDMMKEKKPVWIAGYGWFFIDKIVCDLDSTRIVTHTQNNFVYTKDSTRFYRYEVK